jgi:hypothetical protein
MGVLVAYISKFGLLTVAAAVLFYILLRGDLAFRYPRATRTRPGARPRRRTTGSDTKSLRSSGGD